jgi:hypothetical protein
LTKEIQNWCWPLDHIDEVVGKTKFSGKDKVQGLSSTIYCPLGWIDEILGINRSKKISVDKKIQFN